MTRKPSDLQVLTANRLSDGSPVFLGEDGGWSERIAAARVARDAAAHGLLEATGAAAVAANIVVEPYLVDVEASGGRIEPVRNRERMRTRGPSVRPDLARNTEPECPALAV